jgi:uncharacterized phage-associated protein
LVDWVPELDRTELSALSEWVRGGVMAEVYNGIRDDGSSMFSEINEFNRQYVLERIEDDKTLTFAQVFVAMKVFKREVHPLHLFNS